MEKWSSNSYSGRLILRLGGLKNLILNIKQTFRTTNTKHPPLYITSDNWITSEEAINFEEYVSVV